MGSSTMNTQFFNSNNMSSNNNLTKEKAMNLLRQGIAFANSYGERKTIAVEMKDRRYSLPSRNNVRPSSVLVVLKYVNRSQVDGNCWDVLLTLRPSHMRFHGGLVCLPGGKLEKGEDAVSGALREAKEEVGLNTEDVEVIGKFTSTVTVESISVTPVICVVKDDNIELCKNPIEVQDIFWMPLSEFLRSENHRYAVFPLITNINAHLKVHYFDYSPPGSTNIYTVWGLTGRVLMFTAGVAFHLLPEYVVYQQSDHLQDPLLLGYIPPTAKL